MERYEVEGNEEQNEVRSRQKREGELCLYLKNRHMEMNKADGNLALKRRSVI